MRYKNFFWVHVSFRSKKENRGQVLTLWFNKSKQNHFVDVTDAVLMFVASKSGITAFFVPWRELNRGTPITVNVKDE